MLQILCKNCNTEVKAKAGQTAICGCSNMATIRGNSISALDLSKVVIISGVPNNKQSKAVLSSMDLMWQEERRKRGVRKLTFEER
jgi:hypothetical protein